MRRIILLLTLMVINHSSVRAGNAGNLLVSCQSGVKFWSDLPLNTKEFEEAAYCSGLVNGVMATLIINGNSLPPAEARIFGICNPNPRDKGNFLKTDQSIRVILKYLEEHPEKLHETDAIHAINALKKAFPCP